MIQIDVADLDLDTPRIQTVLSTDRARRFDSGTVIIQ